MAPSLFDASTLLLDVAAGRVAAGSFRERDPRSSSRWLGRVHGEGSPRTPWVNRKSKAEALRRAAAEAREAAAPTERGRRPTISGVVAADARVERRAALAWRRGP